MKWKSLFYIIGLSILMVITPLSCKVRDTLSNNNGMSVIHATTNRSIIKNCIPDGYKRDDIRIYKGNKSTLIIPYIDSSIFYIGTDIYNNPNRYNIERLQSIASSWRIHFELLYAIKEKGIPDELKQKKYAECNCAYSDLLDYEMPEILDLRGECERYCWRDVLKNGVCVGYIVKDTTKVKLFDQCIETSICKIPERMKH